MKKKTSSQILSTLAITIVGMLLSSCIYETPDSDADGIEDGDGVELTLKIGAVAADSPTSGIVETVESLRIIMLNESGELEVNEKVQLPLAQYAASKFNYIYIRTLSAGRKNFYLVANEDRVGQVSMTDMSGMPEDLELESLPDLLDYFQPSTGEDNSVRNGQTFENALNRVYFGNDYDDLREGNNIYLPYSSHYVLDVRTHVKMESDMFLVPVATKFDFVITNYRQKNAKIDDIILSSVNSHNFLNAQLTPEEEERLLDGNKLWWVDWLQKCSVASETADDMVSFNRYWGWIKDYSLPLSGEATVEKILNPNKVNWTIDKLVDKMNPSKLTIGPFYFAESKNPVPENVEDLIEGVKDADGNDIEIDYDSQFYMLTFKLHDEDEEEVTVLTGNYIDTLKALFRGTHVVVHVELYESKVDIYSEIYPWNDWKAQGFVQEADDD